MLLRSKFAFLLSAMLVSIAAAASTTTHHTAVPSSSHAHSGHKLVKTSRGKSRAHASHVIHGQQAIEPERVTQIQQALIREHYMTGEANGQWDATTQAAMQKYQLDQGWQTRLMPDSRALKKLGLGPDYSGAINAKNSSFAGPEPVSGIPADQAAGFAAAAGVNR